MSSPAITFSTLNSPRNFDELDTFLRIYETSHDQKVLPGVWMVLRLDGRGFTGFTERQAFEKPFDIRFRDTMVETTNYLMTEGGFSPIYGYTQSDEISLLLPQNSGIFDRKVRKLISIAAGIASGIFSLKVGQLAVFDCRVSQLPSWELVAKYFDWRQQDAARNALNGYCYWKLRQSGKTVGQATKILNKASVSFKNELLFKEFNINFNETPLWQRRGVGLYTLPYLKEGYNPITGETVVVERRRVKVDEALPMGLQYQEFLTNQFLGNPDALNQTETTAV